MHDVDALAIVKYPAPVLRKKALAVNEITDEVRDVATKMIELMHLAPGVGLAAPQVGISWRLFVANPTGQPEDDRVYVNPKFLAFSRELEDYDEGCLSLPQINAPIRRPVAAELEWTDLDGQIHQEQRDDLLARVWQHEYDHLDGIMIIDRMAPLDRMAHRKLLKQMERDAVSA